MCSSFPPTIGGYALRTAAMLTTWATSTIMATLVTTTLRTTTVVPRLSFCVDEIDKVGRRTEMIAIHFKHSRELHMSKNANMPEDADDLNFMFKTNNC